MIYLRRRQRKSSHNLGNRSEPDGIHSEVASRTLTNLGHDGIESGGTGGVGAVHRPTKGNLPRTLLADAPLLAVLLGDEGPADGHITGSALSCGDKTNRVALLVTQELGDGVAGNGKLGHGVSPVEFVC